MTDDELRAIEREAIRRIKYQPDWSTDGNDLLRLAAEVRRLQAIVDAHAAMARTYREGMRADVDGGEPVGLLKVLLDALERR